MIGTTEDPVDECVRLTPRETAAGREFTDPDLTTADLWSVRVMLGKIQQHVPSAASLAAGPRLLTVEEREADGRAHRAIVCNARRLADDRDVAWVGFFAVKRLDRDSTPLTLRDDELIREFPAHPGILSYSSLELAGEDWGNLILLEGDEAREQWRASPRHADAVRELAPRHYTDVRLHQGTLLGGVLAGREPCLRRTKYYDYRGGVTWRAEREWPPDVAARLAAR
jgi:hypothetical protein